MIWVLYCTQWNSAPVLFVVSSFESLRLRHHRYCIKHGEIETEKISNLPKGVFRQFQHSSADLVFQSPLTQTNNLQFTYETDFCTDCTKDCALAELPVIFLLHVSDAGGLTWFECVRAFIRRLGCICNTSWAATWLLGIQENACGAD